MVDGIKKNFTDADDALLLKQIIVDEPHKVAYGKVMERSQVVADALNASDEFSRDNLTAKTAQNRFSLLLECPQNNKKAARGSGITEEYKLKHELLDEALLLVDENRHEQDKAKAEARAKPQASEKPIEEVRELAIQRHRRRGLPGDDSTVKPKQSPNKFAKRAEVLREHKEKELEIRLTAEAHRREDQKRLMQVLTLLVKK